MRQAVAAITAKVTAEWPHADVPVLWANDPNEIPGSEFLFVNIVGEGETHIASGGGYGNNEWEQRGRIETAVLVPINTGVDRAWQLADAFAAIFRGQRFSGVSCYGASIAGGDRSADDGSYWQVFVIVDFAFRVRG